MKMGSLGFWTKVYYENVFGNFGYLHVFVVLK